MRTKTIYLTNFNGLTGEKAMLILPLRPVPVDQRRAIIAIHGHGADASVWTPGWPGARHAQALADAGYYVVSIDAGGTATFNNKAAMDAITSAYGYIVGTLGIAESKVGLFGWSMGGGNSLQWIKENPTKVWACLIWAPLTDLDYHCLSGGVPTAEATAAYSPPIYVAGDYFTNSVGHKIADEYPTWRNKCPIRIIQGSADTTVPLSKSQAFIDGVNAAPGTATAVDMVVLTGSDHSTLFANIDTDETLAFFRDNEEDLDVYVPAPVKLLSPESVMYQDSARTTLALANNDPVGSWTDIVGNQHASQATSTKCPLLKTNVLNGYRVLQFDKTNDYMEATITARIISTWFIVAKKVTALDANGRGIIGWKLNSSNRIYMYASTAVGGYGWYANESLLVENLGGDPTGWEIICINHPSASVCDVRFSGGAPHTFDSNDILTTAVTMMLGANNEASGTFGDWQYAEIQRYAVSLSFDQMDHVGGLLADKYGLVWDDVTA